MPVRLTFPNLVTNAKVYEFVKQDILPSFHTIRQDRLEDDQRNLHFWKIFNCELDDQSYQGRSRVYISAGRTAIETWRISLLQALFPFSDWFDCQALHGAGLEGNAQAQKAVQRRWIQQMKLRDQLAIGLQQYLVYGTMVLRQTYDEVEELQRFFEHVIPGAETEEDTEVVRTEALMDETPAFYTRTGRVQLVERMVKTYSGPRVRPVDLMHFFMAPTTVPPEDAEIMFEDITVSISHLEAMHEKFMDPRNPKMGRLYDRIEEIVETRGGRLPLDVEQPDMERFEREEREQDPNIVFADLEEGFVNLTECFWKGEIPGARDPETKKEYGVRDWMIVAVNDKWPIRIHPNPSYRNRRPWRVGRLVKCVNQAYGTGMVAPFASIQYMLNDIGNLTIDNLILSLNPIAIIDDEMVSNFDSLQLLPGAKWFMKPDGVKFESPQSVAQLGQAMMSMMTGMLQDQSGANFAVQGTPAPRGRGRSQNTATGLAMLQSSGSAGFRVALDDLQNEIMVPILEVNYEMQEQFMSDRERMIVGGADAIPLIEKDIGFEDVVGKYLFTWKGAQQVQERMALTQGLQGLIQMLAQIRMADPAAAQAFTIKWGVLAKRFLTDGLGLSWADEVITMPEDERSVDPMIELDLMAAHRSAMVEPGDDDLQHVQVQSAALQAPPFSNDPIAAQLLQDHLMAHMMQAQTKQAQAAEAAQARQAAMMGGPPSGMASPPGPPGQGGAMQQAAAQGQPQGVANA